MDQEKELSKQKWNKLSKHSNQSLGISGYENWEKEVKQIGVSLINRKLVKTKTRDISASHIPTKPQIKNWKSYTDLQKSMTNSPRLPKDKKLI